MKILSDILGTLGFFLIQFSIWSLQFSTSFRSLLSGMICFATAFFMKMAINIGAS